MRDRVDGGGVTFVEFPVRHRHQEFLEYLRSIDKDVPAELDIHCIVDHYASHKHPRVKARLATRALSHALHPDVRVLARPGRTLLLNPLIRSSRSSRDFAHVSAAWPTGVDRAVMHWRWRYNCLPWSGESVGAALTLLLLLMLVVCTACP